MHRTCHRPRVCRSRNGMESTATTATRTRLTPSDTACIARAGRADPRKLARPSVRMGGSPGGLPLHRPAELLEVPPELHDLPPKIEDLVAPAYACFLDQFEQRRFGALAEHAHVFADFTGACLR